MLFYIHSAKELINVKRLLLLISYYLLTLSMTSALADTSPPLTQWLESSLPKTAYQPHIGIIIQSAKTGKILYQKNATQLFTPASIQKLFVATAALLYLHPDFTYTTTITSNHQPVNHTLKGNAYLKFSGDPYLSSKDLNQLFKQLKHNGVTHITGALYLDTSAFDSIYYPPGWLWDDLSYSFAAPMSAANIDQNKFILHLLPANQTGRPPQLSPNLPSNVLTLSNHAVTTAHYQKTCPLTVYSDTNNHYSIGGCLVKPWKKQRRSLAIRNPEPYIISKIQTAMNTAGISAQRIQFKTTPLSANHPLSTHHSASMSEIVKHMLTQSDNLAADTLLKTLGHHYYKEPGTWQNGIHALQHILSEQTGIDFHLALLTDGAGLSRYNLASPKQFTQLLYFIQQHSKISDDLKAALPKPGGAGTLAHRMHQYQQSNRVAAKTGSMTGISSLAGYINTRHNNKLIFVIMVNGFVGPSKKYQQFEDKLCQYLISTSENLYTS